MSIIAQVEILLVFRLVMMTLLDSGHVYIIFIEIYLVFIEIYLVSCLVSGGPDS